MEVPLPVDGPVSMTVPVGPTICHRKLSLGPALKALMRLNTLMTMTPFPRVALVE
jgi:hypothetical protein